MPKTYNAIIAQSYYHQMCVKVKEQVAKTKTDNINFKWFCDLCFQEVNSKLKKPAEKAIQVNSTKILEKEIELLKKISNEKEQKYNLVLENNSLLKQNIDLLQDNIKQLKQKKEHNKKFEIETTKRSKSDQIQSAVNTSRQVPATLPTHPGFQEKSSTALSSPSKNTKSPVTVQ
ncbi:unnamed protein product [Psylliodes chrysocephalus]|uniref:Uncharacterized protein n=1 Tax=Psylliodes chrysocephalus TaxID=3402493 RepID=A0A9P0GCI7_9CUCU|nr:unnamed protein product [Psylliodes chrysocephala]